MNRFEFIKTNPASVDKIAEVRLRCGAFGTFLETLPDCRERSLAMTKLEEVAFWANRGICVSQDK